MTSPRRHILALAIVLVVGCQSAQRQTPVAAAFEPRTGATQSYLSDWQILGPFGWESEDRESGQLISGLKRPLAPFERLVIAGDVDLSALAMKPRTVHVDNGEVRLHQLLSGDGYQGAYAVSEVSSATDTVAALLVEADDAVRVYMNGQLVHEHAASRRLQQYEDYVPVRLRKGRNQVALKLVTGSKRGGELELVELCGGATVV
jgi:hypothetical protein